MKEESLYKYVENFLKGQLECFATFQKAGTKYTGYADVVGIKDVGGRTSGDFEVIAVEVKKSTYEYAKNLGQALGYSLLAHRCYLATYLEDLYTSEQEQMATRLGVGLVRICEEECDEVLSSPYHEPINSLMLKMLENAGFALCSICGTLVSSECARASPKANMGWQASQRENREDLPEIQRKSLSTRKILEELSRKHHCFGKL